MAFIAAVLIIVVIHAFFYTLYIDKNNLHTHQYLIKISKTPARKNLCLYKHNGKRYFSRVMAKSGDSLKLHKGIAYINGTMEDTSAKYLLFRKLKFKNTSKNIISDTLISMTDIKHYSQNEYFTKVEFPPKTNNPAFFPYSYKFRWNADYSDYIFIPGKKYPVAKNEHNISLYKNTTKSISDSLIFQHNYFYMLNDNRSNINDSRSFGFISEDSIVGYVAFELTW